jgi:hypothetical protein
MIMATLILIFSTALFFFYLQGVCQKILRRHFAEAFWQVISSANGFEFPMIRQTLKESDAPIQYASVVATLKRDFQTLTYLTRNAANFNQRYSNQERFLIVYSKFIFLSLTTRHWLRLREKPAVLKLTAILEYFANVVGERVNAVRFENLTASDYLLNL